LVHQEEIWKRKKEISEQRFKEKEPKGKRE